MNDPTTPEALAEAALLILSQPWKCVECSAPMHRGQAECPECAIVHCPFCGRCTALSEECDHVVAIQDDMAGWDGWSVNGFAPRCLEGIDTTDFEEWIREYHPAVVGVLTGGLIAAETLFDQGTSSGDVPTFSGDVLRLFGDSVGLEIVGPFHVGYPGMTAAQIHFYYCAAGLDTALRKVRPLLDRFDMALIPWRERYLGYLEELSHA